MSGPSDNQKRALRAEIRERRRSMPSEARAAATTAITAHLKSLVDEYGATSISCYLSGDTEPNTRPFVNWAFDQGIRILFPVSRDDGLLDWVVGDGHSERISTLGLPEVVGELVAPIELGRVDVIFVPALSIDAQGDRLGQGRGYYDKCLGSMDRRPPTFAVVFDSEFVDEVPTLPNDVRVDGVVTPSAIRRIR